MDFINSHSKETEINNDFNELNENHFREYDYDPNERITLSNIKECAEPFHQEIWSTLKQEEMIESISQLKNVIADDLGIENTPKIEYYYNENNADYGEFISESNTISINVCHFDDPKEIAKTLIHELRHCWQIERITLPKEKQNSFDKVLQYNQENYISPFDNYYAYLNQPMEIDARLYAEDIISNYFKNEKYEE